MAITPVFLGAVDAIQPDLDCELGKILSIPHYVPTGFSREIILEKMVVIKGIQFTDGIEETTIDPVAA